VKKLTVRAFRDGTLTSQQGTPADTEEGEREGQRGERESSYRGLQGNHFWGRHIHILSKSQQETGAGRLHTSSSFEGIVSQDKHFFESTKIKTVFFEIVLIDFTIFALRKFERKLQLAVKKSLTNCENPSEACADFPIAACDPVTLKVVLKAACSRFQQIFF
jgi:hypothetical protein